MKYTNIRFLMIIGFLAFFGCNKSDDGSYVAPITVYEKIAGQWNLMNLKMVDEVAKATNISPNEQNLSTWFNYDTFQITFNVDGDNQPTTYEVMGNVPPLFAASGYYELSTPFQPTTANPILIHLYSDAAHTNLTDVLQLTAVPGTNAQMQITLVRTSGGTPFVSYVFNLMANN
ncbi:DUF5004 domain-containing protein [Mangrovimonas xylaniphaga]|uniref:DUF5004 domain-containing protein n=1 Tax=Mangrovimonas xylaniphaga TaxID=1645915 RepID=UPI0006B57B9B|nr:DUF5004 domain-containing protein [Mangrovimonas xylaniphaga]